MPHSMLIKWWRSANRPKSLSRKWARQLIVEGLENRLLFAGDVVDGFTDVVLPDALFRPLDSSSFRGRGISKGTHHYRVGETQVDLAIDPRRIALNVVEAARLHPALMSEWGLSAVRSVGSDFVVYESSEELGESMRARLISSGLVERSVPVFRSLTQAGDAVLLNEAIVALGPGVEADSYFANHTAFESVRRLDGTRDQYVVTLAAGFGEQALQSIHALEKEPAIAWVAPNFYQSWQKFYIPNDPRFPNLWHLHNTGQGGGLVDADSDLPEAWDIFQGGSPDLTIAVVDDGVSIDHQDLNVWTNLLEVPSNGIDDDGNGWIDDVNGWNFVSNDNVSFPTDPIDGHGTSVAGVAAARGDNNEGVAGASYGSKVLSARIFAGDNTASDANIAAAIYYAAGRTRDGLGTWKAADLSNHSWGGGTESPAINDALAWATSQGRQGKGSLQVFAAGNFATEVIYPATQAEFNPGMVVVGAMSNFGNVALYSSFGPLVDVVTGSSDFIPGTLTIDTTDRVGADGYSSDDYTGTGSSGFGGTSSAAPLATGIAALAIAYGEQLGLAMPPTLVRNLIRANTDLTVGETFVTSTGKSYFAGYGTLNAASLLRGLGKAEISVTTTQTEIFDDSTTIDFAETAVGSVTEATFRIRNQGTLPLNLSEITVDSSEFVVVSTFGQSVLEAGESTNFSIGFAPSVVGSLTGMVNILSDDLDESIFSFQVNGVGNVPAVTGNVFEDWSGDGFKDPNDATKHPERVYLDQNLNGTFDRALTLNSFSSNGPVPIIDFLTSVSTIDVAGTAGSLSNVTVTVNIQHTYVWDLDLVLVAPDGTRLLLASAVGLDGADFVDTVFDDAADVNVEDGLAPFTGSFRPFDSLSDLEGINPSGTWSLEVTDFAIFDDGFILNWSLNITAGESFVSTDSAGQYIWDDLDAGAYRIAPVLNPGWQNTGEGSFSFDIVDPSTSYSGVDFGLAKQNRFYAQVFEDLNGDGINDTNEPGVMGQRLFFDNDRSVTQTTTNSIPGPITDLSTNNYQMDVVGLPSSITDVNVILNIRHGWTSDLDVFLISPAGTRVELLSDVGGSGNDFVGTILDDAASDPISSGLAPFKGSFRPASPLSALNNSNPNGVWLLEITDDEAFIDGLLESWSLEITSLGGYEVDSDPNGQAYLELSDGEYAVGLDIVEPWFFTLPTDGTRSGIANGSPILGQSFGIRKPLSIKSNSDSVVGVEGEVLSQSGNWYSLNGFENLSLAASVGTVIKNGDGTWSWSINGLDDTAATQVTITANDGNGGTDSVAFTYAVTNANPSLTVAQANVSGNVLSTLTNSGTWSDVPSDVVTLSASLGTVIKNGDGTWSWSLTPSQSLTSQIVTITGSDEDGGSSQVQFAIDALVAVVNSKVYYKGSSFANTSVEAALAPNKVVAKSGAAPQRLGFANLINSTRGINGLVFDVAGLAASSLTAADFTFRMSPTGTFNEAANPPSGWAAAPAPTLIDVTPGTATTAARVRLEFADNAIANRWLQIRILNNANTGLVAPQAYYIGHLLGEANGGETNGSFFVQNSDLVLVREAVGTAATVSSMVDLDKNGLHQNADIVAIRPRVGVGSLRVITIPPAGSGGEGEADLAHPSTSLSSLTSESHSIGTRVTNELHDVPWHGDLLAAREIGSNEGSAVDLWSLDEYFRRLGRVLR